MMLKYFCILCVIPPLIRFVGCVGAQPGGVVFFGGHVLLEDGSPLEGVEVTFYWPDPPNVNSDGTWTVLTDEDGWYSTELNSLFGNKDFTITPYHPDYDFSPIDYSFGESYEDQLDIDFVAIPND
jgi:hypothetical protein